MIYFLIILVIAALVGCSSSSDDLDVIATRVGPDKLPKIFEPSWSPDGEKIVVSSAYQMHSQLGEMYVLDIERNSLTHLGESTETYRNPEWSPEGSKIAFWSNSRSPKGIWTIDLDGLNEQFISEGLIHTWSPDGTRLAIGEIVQQEGNSLVDVEIKIVDLQSKSESEVFSVEARSVLFEDMTWSPDGTLIALLINFYTDEFDLDEQILYVINQEGTVILELNTSTAIHHGLDWLPDSSFVTFWTSERIDEVRTTGFHRLRIENPCEDIYSSSINFGPPEFSPNGEFVAFIRQESLFVASSQDIYEHLLTLKESTCD